MFVRIATGLVLAPLLVWVVLWAPKAALYGVLGFAAWRCTAELLRMYRDMRMLDRIVCEVLTVAVALSPLLGPALWPMVVALGPLGAMTIALWRVDDVGTAARRAGLGVLAIGYVGMLIGALVAMYGRSALPAAASAQVGGFVLGPFDEGRGALMGTFVIVFAGDTGAYFAGRAFGRRRFHALVSPKKTVEGAVGGLIASMAAGLFTIWALLPGGAVVGGLALGAAVGIAGQLGDLAESLFKRATDTKDSGALLPGHGGMLDRVDGVLFGGAVVQAWLALRG
ncbi:MAG: hypothetical protein EXR79_02035 [Myxococcales bacterium]|nr:hypothetical protein [Myxococcales bacterium]